MAADSHHSPRVDRALTVPGRGRGPGGKLHPRTVRKYGKGYAGFERWARSCGLTAMPATSETVAVYADELRQAGYAVGTVAGLISAVMAKHRERGHPVPDGVPVWFVLRGADLSSSDGAPVASVWFRRAALISMLEQCDVLRPAGVRDRCLAALGWDLYLKVEELVALDIGHIQPVADGLLVRLGDRWLPVGHDHDPAVACPVEATTGLVGMLAEHGARSGPLFRYIDKADNVAGCGPMAGVPGSDGGRLNTRSVRRIWAKMVVRAGVQPCGPRMLRLGGALDDLLRGVPIQRVRERGRWSWKADLLLLHMQQEATGGAGVVAGG